MVPSIKLNKSSPNLWHGICNFWEDFSQCIVWRIGDGKSVRNDNWIPNFGCLSKVACHQIPNHESI